MARDREAWALGGSLEYRSGRLADRFQIGAELFTSQPLYAPADADGTLLLKPGQEGYTVLGQLYAKLRLGDDDVLTVGRREFSTPYVNRQFNRMTPNTFEAVALKGSFTGAVATSKFDYELGYLSKVKLRNADTFIPMSQAVPFATEDEGTVLAQALFTVDDWAFGVANYFTARHPQHLLRGSDLGACGGMAARVQAIGPAHRRARGRWALPNQGGQLLSRNIGLARNVPRRSTRCSTSPCRPRIRRAASSAPGGRIRPTPTRSSRTPTGPARKRLCSASPTISPDRGFPG